MLWYTARILLVSFVLHVHHLLVHILYQITEVLIFTLHVHVCAGLQIYAYKKENVIDINNDFEY